MAKYIYPWGNPLYDKFGTFGHTSPECISDAFLSWAESSHLKNLYQRSSPNCKFDISISVQAHNGRECVRDHQYLNNNPGIAQSNFATVKAMQPTTKRSIWVVEYNGDFDSDDNNKDIEFVDLDLPCNKLSLQLLANDSITHTKKK